MPVPLSDYVSRLVNEAPPLDDTQRAVILSALDGHMPTPETAGRAA